MISERAYRRSISYARMEDEQQVQNCIELIEYMNPILEQKVLTNLEQNSMTERMDEVLEKAWSLDTGKDQQCGLRKTVCKACWRFQDYEKCGKWCTAFHRAVSRSARPAIPAS